MTLNETCQELKRSEAINLSGNSRVPPTIALLWLQIRTNEESVKVLEDS
jgi:hypothetical protein